MLIAGNQQRDDDRRPPGNGRKIPPRRHAGRVHDDELGIVAELVEHVSHRDHQGDRRDDQDQQRDERPVMPMKTRMVWPWLVIRSMSRNACVIQISAVTLVQTTRNAPKRGAENVAADRPHPLTRPRSRHPTHVGDSRHAHLRPISGNPRSGAPAPVPRRGAPSGKPIRRYSPRFDPATKWLGQGKAIEYAQQSVNLARVARWPQACAPDLGRRRMDSSPIGSAHAAAISQAQPLRG